jgi:hypothetical protein
MRSGTNLRRGPRPRCGFTSADAWRRRWCGTRLRAVSSATVKIVKGDDVQKRSTPDDHFTASPYRRVVRTAGRRICSASSHPYVRNRIVSAAREQVVSFVVTAPDDHFSAGPHRRVKASAIWNVDEACRRPAVRGWIVSATGVQVMVSTVKKISTPDDHCAVGPHCCVIPSGTRRTVTGGACPAINAGIISSAGVEVDILEPVVTSPDDHLAAGPHCGVNLSGSRGCGRRGCPTVRVGVVPSAGIQILERVNAESTLDNHFAATPDGGVVKACVWHVSEADRRPGIRAGIISPAGVKNVVAAGPSAPDDHLAAGPHCCVTEPGIGRVGRAGGCPAIGAGIVFAPGVKNIAIAIPSAPHDHFSASPHRCVSASCGGYIN